MTTYAYDHLQQTSAPTSTRRSWCLAACLSACLSACASRSPQQAPQAPSDHTLTLTLRPWLDLTARQRLDEAWLRRLTRAVSDQLAPLHIRLTLGAPRAWSLGDEAQSASLESLKPALLSALQAISNEQTHDELADEGSVGGAKSETSQKKIQKKTQKKSLWVAINSFPPPSYPRLHQLALGARGEPLVMLRDLRAVSGVSAEEAERAMARLLARELARALGAIEGCEPDAMSLKRDALLGWQARGRTAASPQSPQAPRRGASQPNQIDRTLGARARSADSLEDEGERPLPPLTWSKTNRALIALSESSPAPFQASLNAPCERLELLSLSCEAHLASARASTHACLTTPQAWVEANESGRLSPSGWGEERRLARGLERYLKGAWREAFELCEPIASTQPSSLASLCAGVAATELKRDEQAARYLRAHLAAHPQEPTATLTLSKVLGQKGEHKAAEALLQGLLKAPLTPQERARALYNLGVARAQQGRWREALEAWRSIEEGTREHKKAQPLIQEALRFTQASPPPPQPR